jgi:hypothetical protein
MLSSQSILVEFSFLFPSLENIKIQMICQYIKSYLRCHFPRHIVQRISFFVEAAWSGPKPFLRIVTDGNVG